ncbi:efflux RND transporter periplasmic adaptor subunit [Roseovarius sp. CAU 1744]|uniref:efflux RND transporter periplasmic adaptor subunit n=1 Tax=Roseovarius sp. CAU 1744 TaxID=3140368 RepID=UPI00325A9540
MTILALGAGIAGGIWLERERGKMAMGATEAGPQILYWVAPMDPNFRKEGPGKSPMGMDLVPVYDGDEPSGDPEDVTLTAAEVNTIGVRTAVARVQDIARRIETVGFVGYDEHATSHIHTRVEGWIEQLEVRAEGDAVKQGDVLFELYAPEITIASSELMRATQRKDADEINVARTKLRNFGVNQRQIDEMAKADAPAARIRYYAPQDGVVVNLTAADGMYLQPDTRAMTLGDLSTVWLLADVFERDIGRLSLDMLAEARFEHIPNRLFTGEIDYVFPELDTMTRTLRVRLRFDNSEGILKPNMFATVALKPRETQEALTVPSEAVIRTGRAERVILKTDEGTFRPRLVATGLRDGFGANGRTVIEQGLAPGDEVVASAQFLIDSESALNAGILRFAPTEADPVEARGVLISFAPESRRAVIRHEAIPTLDWPALETEFAVRSDVFLDELTSGDEVKFKVFRGADGLLAISVLGRDDGVDATGMGMVHAITPEGKLSISHEPIPALGWPAMQMDMDLAGVDPADIPLDTNVEFDLAQGEDGLYVIVGVRPEGAAANMMAEEAPAESVAKAAARPIIVDGVIQSVDPETRQAMIAHGPIAEIGMPGMMMAFDLAEELDLTKLPLDQEVSLTFARPDGMNMVLKTFEAMAKPMKVMGVVNSIDPETSTANVTHGPITEIGMPGMTMDFALDGALDPATIPLGQETGLLLVQGEDMSLTLQGLAEDGS